MKYPWTLKGILIAHLMICPLAYANDTIQIESDSARYDHHKGQMIHQGHVMVHWQDRVLTADTLIIYKSSQGELSELQATGKPATFQGSLEADSAQIQGSAKNIHFQIADNTVVLKKEAQLDYNGDVFQGPIIRFNFNNQSIYADKSDTVRPKLIFGANLSNLNPNNKARP